MTQRHRYHDILAELVAKPSEVLAEFNHPALALDDKARARGYQRWCTPDHTVPEGEFFVLCGITTSTLSLDTDLHFVVGVMRRGEDPRRAIQVVIAPPRQWFSVDLQVYAPEPAGLLLLHGWRLSEAEYHHLWRAR